MAEGQQSREDKASIRQAGEVRQGSLNRKLKTQS